MTEHRNGFLSAIGDLVQLAFYFPDGPSIYIVLSLVCERIYYSGKCGRGHLDISLKIRIFDSAHRSDK